MENIEGEEDLPRIECTTFNTQGTYRGKKPNLMTNPSSRQSSGRKPQQSDYPSTPQSIQAKIDFLENQKKFSITPGGPQAQQSQNSSSSVDTVTLTPAIVNQLQTRTHDRYSLESEYGGPPPVLLKRQMTIVEEEKFEEGQSSHIIMPDSTKHNKQLLQNTGSMVEGSILVASQFVGSIVEANPVAEQREESKEERTALDATDILDVDQATIDAMVKELNKAKDCLLKSQEDTVLDVKSSSCAPRTEPFDGGQSKIEGSPRKHQEHQAQESYTDKAKHQVARTGEEAFVETEMVEFTQEDKSEKDATSKAQIAAAIQNDGQELSVKAPSSTKTLPAEEGSKGSPTSMGSPAPSRRSKRSKKKVEVASNKEGSECGGAAGEKIPEAIHSKGNLTIGIPQKSNSELKPSETSEALALPTITFNQLPSVEEPGNPPGQDPNDPDYIVVKIAETHEAETIDSPVGDERNDDLFIHGGIRGEDLAGGIAAIRDEDGNVIPVSDLNGIDVVLNPSMTDTMVEEVPLENRYLDEKKYLVRKPQVCRKVVFRAFLCLVSIFLAGLCVARYLFIRDVENLLEFNFEKYKGIDSKAWLISFGAAQVIAFIFVAPLWLMVKNCIFSCCFSPRKDQPPFDIYEDIFNGADNSFDITEPALSFTSEEWEAFYANKREEKRQAQLKELQDRQDELQVRLLKSREKSFLERKFPHTFLLFSDLHEHAEVLQEQMDMRAKNQEEEEFIY